MTNTRIGRRPATRPSLAEVLRDLGIDPELPIPLTEAEAEKEPFNPFTASAEQAGEQAAQGDVTTRRATPRLVRKDPMAEFHDALRSHLIHLSIEMNIESLKKMETFCRLAREMLAQCWVSK
jgi:uncharacterized protein (DUF2336 family)